MPSFAEGLRKKYDVTKGYLVLWAAVFGKVAEDEKSHPLTLVTIGGDGSVDSTALTAGLWQVHAADWRYERCAAVLRLL